MATPESARTACPNTLSPMSIFCGGAETQPYPARIFCRRRDLGHVTTCLISKILS